MADRVTLSRDGVRVYVKPADMERFKSAGFAEPKVEEPKAPATRKRSPRKTQPKSE